MSSRMPTYKEQKILDKVCKVTRQKQIKFYDFIPFFDFQYEKNIFNCQPSHFSPCSAVPVLQCFAAVISYCFSPALPCYNIEAATNFNFATVIIWGYVTFP